MASRDLDDVRGSMSVKEAFNGANVFLTGVTGYVGSMVLEQLLRVCPGVGKVYVFIRGKRNLSSRERLEKLLSSGLFNKLWSRKDLFGKLQVIEGDMTKEDLGLHPKDKEELLRETNFVIHSAAAVALDDPIEITLRNNYFATKRLLDICQKMTNLRSYTHVSTAYVNITFESGSVVKEKIFPLIKGDRAVTHKDIVRELTTLGGEDAKLKAEILMRRFNFPNTYCLGKRLAEELVADYHAQGMPCCIVRPSLITAMERGPFPGYIGNLAGGAGFAIAFAVGFFEKNSAAWTSHGVCDIVPGDVVTSVCLAASAAVLNNKFKGNEVPVFHACTSCTYPVSNFEMYSAAKQFFTKEPAPYCLLWGGYPEFPLEYVPHKWLVFWAKTKTFWKVQAACFMLRWLGKERLANRLTVGWRAWDFANQERYDMNLFFSADNVLKLEEMLPAEEKEEMHLTFTPMHGCWTKYMHVFLAGIKTLLLKTPLLEDSVEGFKMIHPCEPPVKLSSRVERRPSKYSESDGANGGHVVRRTSSTVSAAAMAELGLSMSAATSTTVQEEEGEFSDS